jgi:hypothetical protein
VPADVADFEHTAAGGGFANDDDLPVRLTALRASSRDRSRSPLAARAANRLCPERRAGCGSPRRGPRAGADQPQGCRPVATSAGPARPARKQKRKQCPSGHTTASPRSSASAVGATGSSTTSTRSSSTRSNCRSHRRLGPQPRPCSGALDDYEPVAVEVAGADVEVPRGCGAVAAKAALELYDKLGRASRSPPPSARPPPTSWRSGERKNIPAEALDRPLVAPRGMAGPDMSLRTMLGSVRTMGWRPELPG